MCTDKRRVCRSLVVVAGRNSVFENTVQTLLCSQSNGIRPDQILYWEVDV